MVDWEHGFVECSALRNENIKEVRYECIISVQQIFLFKFIIYRSSLQEYHNSDVFLFSRNTFKFYILFTLKKKNNVISGTRWMEPAIYIAGHVSII